MSQGNVRASALTIAGAYLFLLFLFVWPVVDLWATAWPPRVGNLEWRYGFLGLMTSYWPTPLLATVLSMGLAFVLGHRKTFRGLSILCLLWALFVVIVLILFPLDAIQIRSATPEENRGILQVSAVLSELKHLTTFVILTFLGWGGWKTVGRMSSGKSKTSEKSDLTAEVLKAQKRE